MSKLDVDLDVITEHIKVRNEKQAELQRALTESAEPIIRKGLKAFLTEHPEVLAIHWTQYTPHFNDGEECVFSVRDVSLELAGVEYHEDNLRHSEYSDEWRIRESNPKLADDLNNLNKQVKSLQGVLQQVFGDHAKVKATPEKITVEECDHY